MVCKGEKIVSYNHEAIIDKITKLTERVNTSDLHDNYTDDKDLIWCKRLLSDVKESGLVPSKEEFLMANLMWTKYDFVHTERKSTEENMWKLIDGLLTQENPSKIQCIKIYRRFTNATLRESKEVVDARAHSLKNGWSV